MSKLIAFPEPNRVQEEAALWLAKLDRRLSPQEKAEFEHWLRTPAHHKALTELGSVWNEIDVVSVLAELFPLGASSPSRRRQALPKYVGFAAAACAMMVLLVAVVLQPDGRDGAAAKPAPVMPSAQSYATAVGESRSIALSDGSAITLNTNSAVAVRLSAAARDVFLLRGEANFEVAHDVRRPFNVHANERVVQAVGTAFNVRIMADDNFELTVTEGKVKVLPQLATAPAKTAASAEAAAETLVGASETAIVQQQLETVRPIDPKEMDMRLAWQRGMLIFQGEPLWRVLSEVDRYTDTEFVITDEALRGVRVGGYFRAGDVDGLLVALRENFQIDSRKEGRDRIILTAAR